MQDKAIITCLSKDKQHKSYLEILLGFSQFV